MAPTVRSNLTSHIAIAPVDDHGPEAEVELDHVPFAKTVLTRPKEGLTTYYGKGQIPMIMQQRYREAEAGEVNLYEVRMRYDIDKMAPMTIKPEDFPRTIVLNLPRASHEVGRYLMELIAPDVNAIDSSDDDATIQQMIARYPHLLDALAGTDELASVACYLWIGDTPGMGNVKFATIYDPTRIDSIETIGSEYMQAVAPSWLYAAHQARVSAQQNRGHTAGDTRAPGAGR